jgi:hypothetical protein
MIDENVNSFSFSIVFKSLLESRNIQQFKYIKEFVDNVK